MHALFALAIISLALVKIFLSSDNAVGDLMPAQARHTAINTAFGTIYALHAHTGTNINLAGAVISRAREEAVA